MSGDVHVRFYEGPGVKLPGATHQAISSHSPIAGERLLYCPNRPFGASLGRQHPKEQ